MPVIKGKIAKIWALLVRTGDLVTWDMEKAELLDAFLCFLLHCQVLQPHCLEDKDRGWEKKQPPLWEKVQGHLSILKVHGTWWEAPAGPEGPVRGVSKPLSTLFEKLWQPSEVPTDWKNIPCLLYSSIVFSLLYCHSCRNSLQSTKTGIMFIPLKTKV